MAVTAQHPVVERILDALRQVAGDRPVTLHAPTFSGSEWEYLKDCLDSTFVSSVGRYVDRFEADLAAYTGSRHAIAVVNGTAALHIALKLAGVQPGDEVLVPALTFVATANAVDYCGAVPHFVDSEEKTLSLDPQALREYLANTCEQRGGYCVNKATGRVVRAMVPMHTFGHPVDMEGVLALARDFHIEVVEDATESLGSTYHGRHAGTLGRMGVLSFNGNKIITTGGGGAILTDDPALAQHAKHLTTTAKVPHRWAYVHDEIGYNYRMPNINAALGCAQLEQLQVFIESKRRLFQHYRDAFEGISEARIFAEPAGCQSNYWLQTLVLDKAHAGLRDALLEASNDAGVMTRPAWALINSLKPYCDCPAMPLTVAESLESRVINLPSSSFLSKC